MRRYSGFAVLALFLVQPIRAESPPPTSERSQVVSFLKANVIGKTLELKVLSKIDRGNVEVEFHRKTTFSNLMESEKGFRFDEIASIRQTNFDLDVNGKRVGEGRRVDRTVVVHWEVGERLSTGKLVGFGTFAVNTAVSPEGEFSTLTMGMEGDKLVMLRSTGMYSDFFTAGGRFKPGAADTRIEMAVVKGKLERTARETPYDVDPKTMKRTPAGEITTLIDRAVE
jgi:hypothetical protein